MDLKYNMGVAFGTFAGVLKKSDARNAKAQVYLTESVEKVVFVKVSSRTDPSTYSLHY